MIKKVTNPRIPSLKPNGKRLQTETNSLLNSLPWEGKEATIKSKIKAFTLVELIVVITILAILGTIAFISLQGYSQDSRDAVRISDISRIKTSVELFQLGAGKYPLPTDITEITYSGTLAWSQGLFGEETFKNVTNLDKIPLDPSTDKQYVYSVTNTRQEYQIAGIIEGEIAQNSPRPLGEGLGVRALPDEQVQAGEKTVVLRISGTYNGKILKVSTGGTDYVLAIPSIITSTGFTVEQIASNDYFAYNGYKNLPAQYEGGAYKLLGSDGLNLVDGTNILVYSGSVSTLSSTKQDGIDARKQMLENLQSAYAGSQISHIGEISEILSLDTENQEDTEKLSSTIVSNNLGGSVVSSGGGGSSGGETSILNKSILDCQNSGEILYSTLDGTDIDLTCNDDIMVCSGDGTGYTISACNVGAIIVWTGSVSNVDNSYNQQNIYGKYFQWGRNKGFLYGETDITTTTIPGIIGLNSSTDSYGAVRSPSLPSPYTWANTNITDNWGHITNTNIARRGPCPNNYHIPSNQEWINLITLGGWVLGSYGSGNLGTDMMTELKLPMSGYRDWSNTTVGNASSVADYWSSTPSGNNAYRVRVYSSYIDPTIVGNLAHGYSVRCFKNQ